MSHPASNHTKHHETPPESTRHAKTRQTRQTPPDTPKTPNASNFLKAAIAYASRTIPVFPCAPGGKTPLTRNGFKDGTTDRDTIRRWWTKWPEANIGVPTGTASGVFVLDADVKHGGLEGLEGLEGLPDLPATTRVRTGGGGVHIYLRYPEGQKITNSPGDLPRGLDVRGDGGYVLAPPSVTDAPYVTETKLPIADAPAWLLERISRRRTHGTGASGTGPSGPGAGELRDGGPIGDGRRNQTLVRIGGRLRAEGKGREEIEAALLDINASRCAPALEVEEVIRIAASVSRYAPGNLKPAPDKQTLAIVDDIDRRLWSRAWPGMGGKTERDIMVSLIDLARRYGQRSEAGDGVEVSVGVRALALAAAVSKPSCLKGLGRLYDQGEARRGKPGEGNRSGTIVLLGRANLTHSTTWLVSSSKKNFCGQPLRAPRLRWSSPGFKPKRGLVRGTRKVREAPKPDKRDRINRLGKTCGAVVDALEKFGPDLDLAELAEILGVKRPRDLRRRVMPRLEDAGVVSITGELISLTRDWLEALNRERELAGEIAQFERQMQDNNRERATFSNRHRVKPDPAPTVEKMREARESYPERRRQAIEQAIARLFAERPEYRGRRAGQIVGMLPWYLPEDFPRGPEGVPKDVEVENILDGEAVA